MTTPENQEEPLTVEQLQQQLEDEKVARSKAEASADKRKNRYKSSKAQVKEPPVSTSDDDDDEDEDTTSQRNDDNLESRIEAKLDFYQTNPQAKEFKADIEGYVGKGLNRDEAMKLVYANKNPELLREPAVVNQENIWATAMQGASGWAKKPLSKESIATATPEELDKIENELMSS